MVGKPLGRRARRHYRGPGQGAAWAAVWYCSMAKHEQHLSKQLRGTRGGPEVPEIRLHEHEEERGHGYACTWVHVRGRVCAVYRSAHRCCELPLERFGRPLATLGAICCRPVTCAGYRWSTLAAANALHQLLEK